MFSRKDKLKYFKFSNLDQYPLQQAVFTRRGGVSPPPWDSLNIGGTVGDQPSRVQKNYHRMLAALDLNPEDCSQVHQTHSAQVIRVTEPQVGDAPAPVADSMITDQVGLSLVMRYADCVPILLYDPIQHACGLVHAGWLGSVRHVARAAVNKMVEAFGTRASDLVAGIGPSIGPDHYPVGLDVIRAVEESYPEWSSSLLIREGDLVKLDLWKTNEVDLRAAGVNHIEQSGLCTACENQDWYSHRAEKGRTGRFGAVMTILEDK